MYSDATNIVKNIHVVNKIPQIDMEQIESIAFDEKERSKLTKLGSGAFGVVYEFIGSDGTEYAIKTVTISSWTDGRLNPHEIEERMNNSHDAHFLEALQDTECFPKLYFYIDGTYRYKRIETCRYLIMISEKVKGYQLAKVRDDQKGEVKSEFIHNMSNVLVDKLEESFVHAIRKGILPQDLHQSNLMFDIEKGLAIVVDTGNFSYKNNSMEVTSPDDTPYMRNCIRDTKKLIEDSQNSIGRKGA